jgi:hypothetical protein
MQVVRGRPLLRWGRLRDVGRSDMSGSLIPDDKTQSSRDKGNRRFDVNGDFLSLAGRQLA